MVAAISPTVIRLAVSRSWLHLFGGFTFFHSGDSFFTQLLQLNSGSNLQICAGCTLSSSVITTGGLADPSSTASAIYKIAEIADFHQLHRSSYLFTLRLQQSLPITIFLCSWNSPQVAMTPVAASCSLHPTKYYLSSDTKIRIGERGSAEPKARTYTREEKHSTPLYY